MVTPRYKEIDTDSEVETGKEIETKITIDSERVIEAVDCRWPGLLV